MFDFEARGQVVHIGASPESWRTTRDCPGPESLLADLATAPDPRSPHGRRFSLPSLLASACAAVLCGQASYTAIALWARNQPPELRLVDAFDGDFGQAVRVTNDSDLAFPVQVVRQKFKLPVVVLFPCGRGRRPSYYLSKGATASPLVNPAPLVQVRGSVFRSPQRQRGTIPR